MRSETTLAAEQFRLQEWTAQVRDCQNRPDGMSVADWCACNGLTKANYYYRLRRVRKAVLKNHAGYGCTADCTSRIRAPEAGEKPQAEIPMQGWISG